MFLPLAGADLVLWIPPEDMHDTHFHVSEYPLLAGEPEGHHLIRAAGNRLQQVVAGWSHQVGCFNEVVVSAWLSNDLSPFPSSGLGQELKRSHQVNRINHPPAVWTV